MVETNLRRLSDVAAMLFCYGYSLAMAKLLVSSWWQSCVLFGRFPLREMLLTVRLSSLTELLYRQTIPCLLGLLLIATVWLPAVSALPGPVVGVIVLMATEGVFLLLKSAQPPAALFLASSTPDAANLLVQINTALSPLRCLALLNPKQMHFLQRNAIADNIRTRDPRIWRSLIHRLVEMTPLIILDGRDTTRGLMDEAFIMLEPQRARKAVFIVDDDRRARALESYGIDPMDHALTCVTEDELVPYLFDWKEDAPSFLRLRRAERPSGEVAPEDWQTLPSLLVAAFPEGFDSEALIREALASNKKLVSILTPFSIHEDGTRFFDLSWEFVHDERLGLMVFEETNRAVIRVDFLRRVAHRVSHRTAAAVCPPITMEQLNQPDPIWSAVHDFLTDLRAEAAREGFTVRFVNR